LLASAHGGDSVLYLDSATTLIISGSTKVIAIDNGSDNQEIVRAGTLALLTLALPAYTDYPVGTIVQRSNWIDDDRMLLSLNPTATGGTLSDTTGIVPGMQLEIGALLATVRTVDTSGNVTFLAALSPPPSTPTAV